MFVKTINTTDFNGNPYSEKFYFNLSKSELLEMELSKDGGLTNYIERIQNEQDVPELAKTFKEILLLSVGKKSDDGRRFIKNQEIRDAFAQSNAFNDYYFELATNADAAAEFIKGVVPQNLAETVDSAVSKSSGDVLNLA